MIPPFLIKAVLKIVLFVLVISGIYVGISYSGLLPANFDLLKKKEATFANTALNVEEVKAVAKLFTQKYVNEIIVRKYHKNKGIIYDTEDQLFLIARGTCYAGTDLTNMKNEDIKVIDSLTVNVTMPKAKILESTINPSGFDLFIAEGYWNKNLKAVQNAKAEAVKKLELMAKSKDILKKADLKSISMMKSFMQAVGFKNVNVTIQ
jgi:hypothetical protein